MKKSPKKFVPPSATTQAQASAKENSIRGGLPLLIQKIQELSLKDPAKAAVILETWLPMTGKKIP